jgi:hypothetical protein
MIRTRLAGVRVSLMGLVLALATPAVALAQSAGTMALVGPGTVPGAQPITAAALNAAVNAQFPAKLDVSRLGQPNGVAPLNGSGVVPPGDLPIATGASLGVVMAGSNISIAGNGAISVSGLAASAFTDTTNAANITSGTLPAARLPVPTGSTLGGVQSAAAGGNQFQTGISTAGVPQFAQPSFGNLSGTASAGQLPAATTGTLGAVSVSTGLGVTAGAVSVTYGTSAGTATQGNDSRVTGACQTSGCTMSGALTPSGGIIGSTTGTSPAAGYVGQVLKSSATGLALTAATITNITSQSLTPGNYICMGGFLVGTTGTSALDYQAFLTTTSASATGIIEPAYNILNFSSAVLAGAVVLPTGSASVLVTSTETIYLDGYVSVATTGSSGYLTCVRIQ